MTLHDLKTWPRYFQALEAGEKTFEIRRADRPFRIGDVLVLREWEPERSWSPDQAPDGEGEIRRRPGRYTGRLLIRRVVYLADLGPFGAPDLVAMGLEPFWPEDVARYRYRQALEGPSPLRAFYPAWRTAEAAQAFLRGDRHGQG